MVRDEPGGSGGRPTRRDVLGTLGASGAVALAGCGGDGTTPTPTDAVEFMLLTAQSGEYGDVGDLHANGFELAVQHVNEGGGLVDAAFDDLDGDGLLGRELERVTEDSENSASTARSRLDRFLGDDGPVMITGGVSGDVVTAMSEVANEQGVPYMAGTAPIPGLTGGECATYTFREQAHARAIMAALGPVLEDEFQEGAAYVEINSDSTEGEALGDAVTSYFGRGATAEWSPQGDATVRPGSSNLEDTVESATTRRPDVLFLNLYGLDAINGLRAARTVLGDDVAVVMPVIDDSLGRAREDDVVDVIGTVPWDLGVGGSRSTAYDDAYVSQYGRATGGSAQAGSGTAHVIYTQTLCYAAAVERAGSLDADAVVAELEGVEYDVGLGTQQLRDCDHQATRPVPVVRGVGGQVADGNRWELLTQADDAVASCDEAPASDCSL